MIENLKLQITDLLKEKYPNCTIIVQEPKDHLMGDIAIPLFDIVKKNNLTFSECQNEMSNIIIAKYANIIISFKLVRGFLNLNVDKKQVSSGVIKEICQKKQDYGCSSIGINQTMVIDFSSPNIAKPFSIGHLRSTIIGKALANLYEKSSYQVVRINHIGDWGTQFGKLIVAYKKWGNKELVEKDPINQLLALYVKFNELAASDEKLINEGREAFKKLEKGDKQYLKLWHWFKEESLKEFNKMYELLDVAFDSYAGESFYTDKMDLVIDELEEKHLLIEDKGAHVVKLDDMIPALIKKSDGSTLYITRDLAALFYRKNTYHFNKMIYVIGNEQTLHIKQLKAVVKKMGYDFDNEIEHINFGLVLQNGRKMSTRKGNIVKLKDVLEEAVDLAKTYIEKKNPNLIDKDDVAQAIGISAIVFNDLKNHRIHDIEFNLEQMLQFEGQTGPYLQYTGVRINSILKQSEFNINQEMDLTLFNQNHYFEVIRVLDKFQNIVEKAVIEGAPSHLAKYSFSLCSVFNSFYGIEHILSDDLIRRHTNIALSYAVKIVLDESIRLLGMPTIDKM